MVQAPVHATVFQSVQMSLWVPEDSSPSTVSGSDRSGEFLGFGDQSNSPLALTQLALRLGKAAWSLVCSMDSAGSW